MKARFLCTVLACCWTVLFTQKPIELGKVDFLRDLSVAQTKARQEAKDIFILFQEVPGCPTCKNFGTQVLSHPHMVELIESRFIPLCIYNNHKGKDRLALQHFKEPSWNNPVVRIVTADLVDVVPRHSGKYTEQALLKTMKHALLARARTFPKYAQLYEDELRLITEKPESIFVEMYCFWSGEKQYGHSSEILYTEAGYMYGKEVVKITPIPGASLDPILKQGQKANCADRYYSDKNLSSNFVEYGGLPGKYRKDPDDKYYLLHHPLRFLPMTHIQVTKINSAIGAGKDPHLFLSPRQLHLFHTIMNDQSLQKQRFSDDFKKSWYELY